MRGSQKQTGGLRRTLLHSHLSVAAIGVAALCVALASILWLRANTLRIAELRAPTARASMLARNGIQLSLAGLRGWVSLGDERFREDRAAAWTREIRPALATLESRSQSWTDPKNAERLQDLVRDLEDLDEAQWWIEDVAQTPGNEPAWVALTRDVAPTAQAILSAITGMIDAEKSRDGAAERPRVWAPMADLRGAFAHCDAMLTRFVADADPESQLEYRGCMDAAQRHLAKLGRRAGSLSERQRGVLAWLQLELPAYERLAERAVALRKADQWNIARHLLATRAVPLADRASELLQAMAAEQSTSMRLDAELAARVSNAAVLLCVATLGGMIGAGWLISRRGADRIAGPIAALSAATEKLAGGRHDEDIPVSGGRELRDLITSFNRMSASLRHSEAVVRDGNARFRSIVENAVDGIIAIDDRNVVELFNPAASRIFGYTADEIVGTNVKQLMTAHDSTQHDEYVARYLRTGHTSVLGVGREVVGRRKDGSTFPMQLALSEVQRGDRLMFIGMVHDLTRRRAIEQELAQAQKLESIGRLAAGIAHEINTPTQFVGDNVRFMQDAVETLGTLLKSYDLVTVAAEQGSVPPALVAKAQAVREEADLDFLEEEIPKACEQALEGVDRISTIVRAMKDFSHPASRNKERTDLAQAIQSTITVARSEWKYVCEVRTAFDPELPRVPCLVAEFNQVILNLIVNAAHAIADVQDREPGETGTITISTLLRGDWAEIRVADTGAGIPEAARAKIFDPFFTTKEVGKGTGQGLAVAHSIVVDKHGGEIAFETQLGKGTTFTVRLPMEDATQDAAKAGAVT